MICWKTKKLGERTILNFILMWIGLLAKVNLREMLIPQTLDMYAVRNECLDLKGHTLCSMQCETLEEVLKRVQFKNINLEATSLDDESAVALFDMVEYYESAVHLNISGNENIGVRGWQACSRMIKKVRHTESRIVL